MRDLAIAMSPALVPWLRSTFRGLKRGFRRRRLVPLLRYHVFKNGRY